MVGKANACGHTPLGSERKATGWWQASNASIDYLCAADFPLPGLVAPVSVVPSAVPLAVPALGVIPDEKPVWGDAPAPGLLLALAALEFVMLAEPS